MTLNFLQVMSWHPWIHGTDQVVPHRCPATIAAVGLKAAAGAYRDATVIQALVVDVWSSLTSIQQLKTHEDPLSSGYLDRFSSWS